MSAVTMPGHAADAKAAAASRARNNPLFISSPLAARRKRNGKGREEAQINGRVRPGGIVVSAAVVGAAGGRIAVVADRRRWCRDKAAPCRNEREEQSLHLHVVSLRFWPVTGPRSYPQ